MRNEAPKPQEQPSALRRRLFRGVTGGVGVLMTVQAKTALGAICASPSAILSGNTSPRIPTGITCSGGLSPGFWKVPQHDGSWPPAGATFPQFTNPVLTCQSGMKGLTLAALKPGFPGTTLESAGFIGGAPSGTGIWAILAFPGSFSGGQLLRHLACAWLNAGYFQSTAAKYPLSRAQIIQMWDQTKSGGLYCPTGCTPANGWTPQQVINYISGMYDLNASAGDPDLCTQN